MSLLHLLAVGRSLAQVSDEPSRYRMAEQGLLPKFGTVAQDLSGCGLAASEARSVGRGGDEPVPAADRPDRTPGAYKTTYGTYRTYRTYGSYGDYRTYGDYGMDEAGAELVSKSKSEADSQQDGERGSDSMVGQSWVARLRMKLGRWNLFKDPFNRSGRTSSSRSSRGIRGGKGKAKRYVGRKAEGPVQGELHLDGVKPVRNDLHDSDLEVVVGRGAAAEGGSQSSPQSNSQSERPKSEDRRNLAAGAVAQPGSQPVWSRIKHQYFGAGKS